MCLACQADTVSPKGVQCVKCSGAKQPNKAKTACMPCPAGHVFSAAKLVCLACPASKAPSEDPRVQGCVCAAGYFNSSTIRLRCIDDRRRPLGHDDLDSGVCCCRPAAWA